MTTNMSLGLLAAGLAFLLVALLTVSVMQGSETRESIARYHPHPAATQQM